MTSVDCINPATEERLASYRYLDSQQVEAGINSACISYDTWRKMDITKRKQPMLKIAALLLQQKKEYAKLIAQEMGKPIKEGEAEIEKCAWVCEHFAKQAEKYLAPQFIETNMKKTMVCYQPLGIVLAIMPWNFPFWQVFRFAAPTIMAGNAIILKHAPNVCGCGNAIAALFLEAGFPERLFQHFIINNEQVTGAIAHEKVVGVSLTGSERAGSAVAATAGKYLKKVVLELGGNDPYLILEDADLVLAADCIISSRLSNAGQVCVAAKRIIVMKEIMDELCSLILERVKNYQPGNPLSFDTTMGPLARNDLRQNLHQQVQESLKQGATLLAGGYIPAQKGFYYPATVLTDVKPGMPAFDDELFGPVIALITVETEQEAIRLANLSRFGLGGGVFTKQLARGERIAREEIQAGSCFVNAYVTSDPRVPFGGIKCSGFGRELAAEGILSFVNKKTISIQ